MVLRALLLLSATHALLSAAGVDAKGRRRRRQKRDIYATQDFNVVTNTFTPPNPSLDGRYPTNEPTQQSWVTNMPRPTIDPEGKRYRWFCIRTAAQKGSSRTADNLVYTRAHCDPDDCQPGEVIRAICCSSGEDSCSREDSTLLKRPQRCKAGVLGSEKPVCNVPSGRKTTGPFLETRHENAFSTHSSSVPRAVTTATTEARPSSAVQACTANTVYWEWAQSSESGTLRVAVGDSLFLYGPATRGVDILHHPGEARVFSGTVRSARPIVYTFTGTGTYTVQDRSPDPRRTLLEIVVFCIVGCENGLGGDCGITPPSATRATSTPATSSTSTPDSMPHTTKPSSTLSLASILSSPSPPPSSLSPFSSPGATPPSGGATPTGDVSVATPTTPETSGGGTLPSWEDLRLSLQLLPDPRGMFFAPAHTSRTFSVTKTGTLMPTSSAAYVSVRDTECTALFLGPADEIWHFYGGATATLHEVDRRGRYTKHVLGTNFATGARPLAAVLAGSWLALEVPAAAGEPRAATYSLLGVTSSPGVNPTDYDVVDNAGVLGVLFPHLSPVFTHLSQCRSAWLAAREMS